MNKRIYQLILLLLFVIQGLNAQTVKIYDEIDSPGTINVQIDMLDYLNVGSISLIIDYDDELLLFGGLENEAFSGISSNSGNGQITVGYFTMNPVNIDGKLLDLKFTYLGGFDTPLEFAAGCEIAGSDLQIIPSSFINGSVSQVPTTNTVELVSPAPVLVGTTATIPVQIITEPNFDEVNAITLKIAYDPDQLEYTGKDEYAISGVTANAANGLLTLEWEDVNTAVNFTSLTTLMDIKFTYNGGGNADLEFVPGCEITYEGDSFPVVYENALVEPLVSDAKLTIETKDGTAGTNVTLDISAADFDASYDDQIGAITLKVGFDPAQLTYTGYSATFAGWVASATNGVLTLQRSNLGGVTLDGNFLDISFNYHGGGAAPVVFNAGTIIETIGFDAIPVDLISGAINPKDWPSKLILGQVSANTGDQVLVPITAEGFTDDVAAMTLKVGFPDGDLIYTGVQLENPNFTGWKVNSTSSQVSLNWSQLAGEPLADGVLMYLKFNYAATGTASVAFNPGVMLTNPNGELIPISLVDGMVGPFITANLKVYLEGTWNGTDMNTTLFDKNLIPMNQPYGTYYSAYTGSENVTTIPADIVDWVLIELRDKNDNSVVLGRRAGFLRNDGAVVDLDGVSQLSFAGLPADDYFIAVRHRNHLDIISATAQPIGLGTAPVDFTTGFGQVFGGLNGIKQIGSVFVMAAGDVNGNGNIFASDRNQLTSDLGQSNQYLNSDVTMDGNTFASDRNLLSNNLGKNNPIP
jgi:hypothetical protein